MLISQLRAKSGPGFELAVRVADETHNDVGGAAFGEPPQEFSRTLARAGVACLSPAHRGSRLPVIILQKRINPLVGAARILVACQCRINRRYKLAGIAPGFCDDLLHLGPLAGPTAEVGLVREPAVEIQSPSFQSRPHHTPPPDRPAA